MMRRCTLLLGAALVLPLAVSVPSSAQEWPSKGDKVFVAAQFQGVLKMQVASRDIEAPLVPCTELEIKNAKPDKPRWTAEFWVFKLQLEGPWRPRMHKTKEACIAQHSAEGEPNVKRSGDTFTIIPANPK